MGAAFEGEGELNVYDEFGGNRPFGPYGSMPDVPPIEPIEPIELEGAEAAPAFGAGDGEGGAPAPARYGVVPARPVREQGLGTELMKRARRARAERVETEETAQRAKHGAHGLRNARAEEPAGAASGDAPSPAAGTLGNLPAGLLVRMRTGIVYIAVNVLCILVHPLLCAVLFAATAGLCAFEFYSLLHKGPRTADDITGIAAAALYPLAAYFLGMRGLVLVTVLLLLVVAAWYVFDTQMHLEDASAALFAPLYLGLQISAFVFIRQGVPGIAGGVLVLVVIAAIWFSDVGAYLVGSKIGKHKMVPHISPKKSWEGFAAGIVVSMAIWCVALAIPGVGIHVWQALLFGALCGVAGVLGDLVESRIKRSVGAKDSGTMLPGHGGIFDRSDSLFPTAVVACALLMLAGCF